METILAIDLGKTSVFLRVFAVNPKNIHQKEPMLIYVCSCVLIFLEQFV